MNNTWSEITYPISIQYRSHWSEWESIREIVQNSLDADKATTRIYKKDGNLVIEDNGSGLQVKHLLFGVSEKTDGENARGRFGEGLKIALIVLKRLGYDTEILSNDLVIKVGTETIEGEECLKLLYKRNGGQVKGTKVIVKGYDGDTFEDRFIIDDRDVLFEDKSYGQILKLSNGHARLYVKDIYVTELENAMFSYNLNNVKLEESRNIPDSWSVNRELGRLWSKVSDFELWKNMFTAIMYGMYEKNAVFRYDDLHDIKPVVCKAFDVVCPNSVVATDQYWSREARWRNKNVVALDTWYYEKLIDILPTDKQFVLSQLNNTDVPVDESMLSIEEKNNLALARELAAMIDVNQHVDVFLMNGCLGKAGNPIKLNLPVLSNRLKTVSVLIHELTHIHFNVLDLTQDQVHKLADMGAMLLLKCLEVK